MGEKKEREREAGRGAVEFVVPKASSAYVSIELSLTFPWM